jgi:hypothetical protein
LLPPSSALRNNPEDSHLCPFSFLSVLVSRQAGVHVAVRWTAPACSTHAPAVCTCSQGSDPASRDVSLHITALKHATTARNEEKIRDTSNYLRAQNEIIALCMVLQQFSLELDA